MSEEPEEEAKNSRDGEKGKGVRLATNRHCNSQVKPGNAARSTPKVFAPPARKYVLLFDFNKAISQSPIISIRCVRNDLHGERLRTHHHVPENVGDRRAFSVSSTRDITSELHP
ncbi:uncharacterized protein LOC143213652 [Lasioglossum baleicum]|uniref:uncharacterized protein LOC143213652 n=1 Tax=Lasioglossum baleicum TaxID=434251 RepID=UPI003FCE826F